MNTSFVVLGGSAPLLLALGHGLGVLQELPLRQRTRERLVHGDVGYFAQGDAGDDNFHLDRDRDVGLLLSA